MNKCKSILRVLCEDESILELTTLKGMNKDEATKLVNEHYHDRLTYKGIEFFDTLYINKLVPFAEKVLKIDSNNGQESYLGYDPVNDVFISGFDVFEDDGYDNGNQDDEDEYSDPWRRQSDQPLGNYVVISTDGKSFKAGDIGGSGMMYGSMGTYNELHRKYPHLIDVRLD